MDRLKRLFRKEKHPEGSISPSGTLNMQAIRCLEDIGYKFVKEIGEGAYGQVVAMKCPKKRKKVAVKIVLRKDTWEQELEKWPQFNHPNVLPLLGGLRSREFNLFIMPMAETTLQGILEDKYFCQRPSAFNTVKNWLKDILHGLEYLHENGTCHLDLKVDNVLITKKKRAVICDYSMINETSEPVRRFGLPHFYHPPEVFQSSILSAEVDGRAFDIYSYGLLCLYSFTGGWFERVVSLWLNNWHRHLYPLLFDALQLPFFQSQIALVFPKATVTESMASSALNLIRSSLALRPECRPEVSVLQQHGFFSGNFEKTLDTDEAWMEFCTSPEENSTYYNYMKNQESYEHLIENYPGDSSLEIRHTNITNERNCKNIPEIVQEYDSQGINVMGILSMQSSDDSTRTVPEKYSQANCSTKAIIQKSSDTSAKTVPVKYSQSIRNTKTAIQQSSDNSTKAAPEKYSQSIRSTKTAIQQSSDISTKTVPDKSSQGIHSTKAISLHSYDTSTENVPKKYSEVIRSTKATIQQSSDTSTKSVPENYSQAIRSTKTVIQQSSDSSTKPVPEKYSQSIRSTETIIKQSSDTSTKTVPEKCSQAIRSTKVIIPQSSDTSTKTVPEKSSQAIRSTKAIRLHTSTESLHKSTKTVAEKSSQTICSTKTIIQLCSDNCTKTVPEKSSQFIRSTKTIIQQSTEYLPEISVKDDSKAIQVMKATHMTRFDHLSEILPEGDSKAIQVIKATHMTRFDHLSEILPEGDSKAIQVMKATQMTSFEHILEILPEDEPKAIQIMKATHLTSFEHLSEILPEDDSNTIHDTKIIKMETSSDKQVNDLPDAMPKKTENIKINEEPGVVQKDIRPRRRFFSGIRKWRIWKIFTCKCRKNRNREVR